MTIRRRIDNILKWYKKDRKGTVIMTEDRQLEKIPIPILSLLTSEKRKKRRHDCEMEEFRGY